MCASTRFAIKFIAVTVFGDDDKQWSVPWRSSFTALCLSLSWLRPLVTDFSLRRPEVTPRSVHVGFVMDKLALEEVSSSQFLGTPLSVSLHRGSPYSYTIWGLNNRPYVAAVQRHSLMPSTWTTTTTTLSVTSVPITTRAGWPKACTVHKHSDHLQTIFAYCLPTMFVDCRWTRLCVNIPLISQFKTSCLVAGICAGYIHISVKWKVATNKS
jgi:hypothetical protein